MNYEEEKKAVEFLKSTWTAFGGLSKEHQEFLRDHAKSVVVISGDGRSCDPLHHPLFGAGNVYRLPHDFQPPEPVPRWFYNNKTHNILETWDAKKYQANPDCVEVPPSDIQYVKDVMKRTDVGEFEYRVPKVGETYINPLSSGLCVCHSIPPMRFVRKAKPAPKMVQKEFEIRLSDSGNLCVSRFPMIDTDTVGNPIVLKFPTLSEAWLCAVKRNMGPTFRFLYNDGVESLWYENPVEFNEDGTPATPVRMRVWVTEEVK